MANFIFEIVEGAAAGQQVELRDALEVGRDRSAGLVLDDDQVSRRHAVLRVAREGPVVEDAGSRNGTYVNGQIVHGSRALVPGDQVRMGLTVLELRTAEQVAAQPSAVRPRPRLTAVGRDVLQPARPEELPPPAPEAQGIAQFSIEESEPAFVPREVRERLEASGSGSDELAALVDSRVKRQTNVAALAFPAISALAVIVYFGVR